MEYFPPVPLRTPPIPPRHPGRLRLSLPPSFDYAVEDQDWGYLVPPPLFSRTKTAPASIHVTVPERPYSDPMPKPPAFSRPPLRPSPSSLSTSSSSSSSSSISDLSAPPSPVLKLRAQTYSPMPPEWRIPPNSFPDHPLRRKISPRKETLRNLRAEQEACLQKMYYRPPGTCLAGPGRPASKKARSNLRSVMTAC